jgi:hypothetical protein
MEWFWHISEVGISRHHLVICWADVYWVPPVYHSLCWAPGKQVNSPCPWEMHSLTSGLSGVQWHIWQTDAQRGHQSHVRVQREEVISVLHLKASRNNEVEGHRRALRQVTRMYKPQSQSWCGVGELRVYLTRIQLCRPEGGTRDGECWAWRCLRTYVGKTQKLSESTTEKWWTLLPG